MLTMTMGHVWISPPYMANTVSQDHYVWPGKGATVSTVKIRTMSETEVDEIEAEEGFRNMGLMSMGRDWDNPLDAEYDKL